MGLFRSRVASIEEVRQNLDALPSSDAYHAKVRQPYLRVIAPDGTPAILFESRRTLVSGDKKIKAGYAGVVLLSRTLPTPEAPAKLSVGVPIGSTVGSTHTHHGYAAVLVPSEGIPSEVIERADAAEIALDAAAIAIYQYLENPDVGTRFKAPAKDYGLDTRG